jgi:hypothetical protein
MVAICRFVDLSQINLGKGDRAIVKNGTYISKHKITVPTELAAL